MNISHLFSSSFTGYQSNSAFQFKVLLLVYKALNGLAPKYIKELLVPYKPRRHLRSEAKGLLDEPRTRLKFGDRAFSISAPRLWNALPQHLKDSTSCQAFKKCLKTHLFRLAPLRRCGLWLKLWHCAALLNILWKEKALYKFQLLLYYYYYYSESRFWLSVTLKYGARTSMFDDCDKQSYWFLRQLKTLNMVILLMS